MKVSERIRMQKYHQHLFEKFGDASALSLGWATEEHQQKRFEVLIQVGDLNNASIIDLGCGFGDLKSLLDQHFSGIRYTGIDYMPEFIEVAQKRFENDLNTTFIQGDFNKINLSIVDYILVSGAFSYRLSDQKQNFSVIEQLFPKTKKGMAFNLLNYRYFKGNETLISYEKEEVIDFCTSLTPHVKVKDDYLELDFTVFMYQEKDKL